MKTMQLLALSAILTPIAARADGGSQDSTSPDTPCTESTDQGKKWAHDPNSKPLRSKCEYCRRDPWKAADFPFNNINSISDQNRELANAAARVEGAIEMEGCAHGLSDDLLHTYKLLNERYAKRKAAITHDEQEIDPEASQEIIDTNPILLTMKNNIQERHRACKDKIEHAKGEVKSAQQYTAELKKILEKHSTNQLGNPYGNDDFSMVTEWLKTKEEEQKALKKLIDFDSRYLDSRQAP